MIMMRLLYDPKKHIMYPLIDGRNFIIDSYRDGILKTGFNHVSPKQKAQWIETVQDIIQNDFNGNTLEASKVLSEVYSKPEYNRNVLYRLLPMLKNRREEGINKTEKNWLHRIIRKLEESNLEGEFWEVYRRKKSIGQYGEQLGTAQCDYQLKTTRKRVGDKILRKILNSDD
jgi:hypothetical protein